METSSKKIQIIALIGLSFIFLEVIVGIGVLFSGFMYHGFEKDKAVLKLELLKVTNNEYYERVTGDQDSLAKADFSKQFQINRKPILISGGFFILIFTFINAIPLVLVVVMTRSKKEDTAEEVTAPPKKEGEETPEF